MIILDTNIISALMLKQPDKLIIDWLDGFHKDLIWLTTITLYELSYGISLLPEGKRKEGLQQHYEIMLREEFRSRILDFETDAAIAAGKMGANHKKSGYTPDIRDIQIAGICIATGAALATRNSKDFEHFGIELINPFKA